MTSIARLLCPYGSRRRVLRGPARGMRVVVEPGIGLAYLLGVDAAAPQFFYRRVEPGMTVFDVGANKGQMALLFASLVGPHGQVLAFEPAPAEFASLERNIVLNRLGNIRPIRAAAADQDGEATFSYCATDPTQGKLTDVEPTYATASIDTLSVRTVMLDGFLETGIRADVIKLDVEGSAAVALRGARRLIAEHAPAFFIELHGPEEQRGVAEELVAHGYVAETLDGTAVPDPTAGWFNPLWCHKPASHAGTTLHPAARDIDPHDSRAETTTT